MNDKNGIARREDSRSPRDRGTAPPCDVYESADEYLVLADMPGIDEQNIDVQLDRTQLTLAAVRTGAANGTVIDTEHASIHYRRIFQIPESVDAGAIKAELRDGVLALHLPKAPAARMRRIAVQAG
jgi:HSP20 family protein